MKITSLLYPPDDIISQVSCNCYSQLVAIAAWDGSIQIRSVSDCNQIQKTIDNDVAILGQAWTSAGTLVYGDNNGAVLCNDVAVDQETGLQNLGCHDRAVSSVCWNSTHACVFSGGCDGKIKRWDSRSKSCVDTLDFGGKVWSIDTSSDLLSCTGSGSKVVCYDLRMQHKPNVQVPLGKKPSNCIKCMSEGNGWILGSLCGTVGVVWLTPAHAYAFKAHQGERREDQYAVNALVYSPKPDILITGGSEGSVKAWDLQHKQRRTQAIWQSNIHSINSLDIDYDGNLWVGTSIPFDPSASEASEARGIPPSQLVLCHLK